MIGYFSRIYALKIVMFRDSYVRLVDQRVLSENYCIENRLFKRELPNQLAQSSLEVFHWEHHGNIRAS